MSVHREEPRQSAALKLLRARGISAIQRNASARLSGISIRHLELVSDAVSALARSETFPRLSIFTFLLLLGQAQVVVGHTLSLRLLRRGAPLVVVRPIGGVSGWHEGCGERR